MQVILLEKVQNLGGLGDKVNVRAGYGRNFLIPKGIAVSASKANVEKFEARRAELEKSAAEVLAAAQIRADGINGKEITIAVKVGDEGKLFGSVGSVDIVEALAAAGVTVEKQELRLPQGAMREVGEYDIAIHLHTDIDVSIKVNVEAE